MLNIDRLLKKKGWTGKDLGRLEVVLMLDVLKQSQEGIMEPVEKVSQAQLQKMLSTIKDPKEGNIFNGYIHIHDWFTKSFSQGIAEEQQAYLNFNTILNAVSTSEAAEEVYRYIEKLPVIMTEKQYSDLTNQRREDSLHPDGESPRFNVFNLLENGICYYVKLLKEEPKKKNLLKPLKKKLEAEPVTDPHILSQYNRVTGNGYYTLEDGTRSDEVSEEEWRELLADTIEKVRNLPDSFFYDKDEDYPAPPDQIAVYKDSVIHSLYTRKAVLDRYRAIYNGATEEEADNIQNEEDIETGFSKRCEWHYYEDPPKDLTKWDIIEGVYEDEEPLYEYYPSLGGEGTDEEQIEEMRAFKEEFPEVVDALLKDISTHCKKDVSSLPVEKWPTTGFSWEDLYKINLYGFKEYIDSDYNTFEGNPRALYNGVAILRPSEDTGGSARVDPVTGYYKAPDILGALSPLSLDGYFTDSQDYAMNTGRIERARKLFLDSYYFLKGYNLALDLIADHYDLEELSIAKINTEAIAERVQSLNDFIAVFYSRILGTNYEEPGVKEKKLGVLKDVLYPIDLTTVEIPEAAIAKVKEDFKDFQAFKDGLKDPIITLCYRGEGV